MTESQPQQQEHTTSQSLITATLQPFTSTNENSRYGTHFQWTKDGWQNATNLAIAVRIKTGDPDHSPIHTDANGKQTSYRFPNMESIFKPHAALFASPSSFMAINRQECDACKNTGRMKLDCDECYGTGETTCDKCGSDHECDTCDGTGTAEIHCTKCENVKLTDDQKIDCKYWYLIQNLPNVAMHHTNDGSRGMMLFMFSVDGFLGQGAVICLRGYEDSSC